MYEIRCLPGAKKYLKKIKEKGLAKASEKALKEISENPYCGHEKTGDLAGVFGLDVFYNKTNEIAYRIYENNGKIVVVILAGSRENFYNQLKRYIR